MATRLYSERDQLMADTSPARLSLGRTQAGSTTTCALRLARPRRSGRWRDSFLATLIPRKISRFGAPQMAGSDSGSSGSARLVLVPPTAKTDVDELREENR